MKRLSYLDTGPAGFRLLLFAFAWVMFWAGLVAGFVLGVSL